MTASFPHFSYSSPTAATRSGAANSRVRTGDLQMQQLDRAEFALCQPSLGSLAVVGKPTLDNDPVVRFSAQVLPALLDNRGDQSKLRRLTQGHVGKGWARTGVSIAESAAVTGVTGGINGSFHATAIHTCNNCAECKDRENRFTFVIRFSSRSLPTLSDNCCKALLYSIFRHKRQASTKGNIHPFAVRSTLKAAQISAENATAETLKTGQTEQFVIQISSARVSRCYQKNAMLPVSTKE